MRDTQSLASARQFAPVAFRQWMLSLIAIGTVCYALLTVVDARQLGPAYAWRNTDALLTLVMLAALVVAAKGRPLWGISLAIVGTWIEVELGFTSSAVVPSPAIMILPMLGIGVGLLFGRRAALAYTVVTIVVTTITHLFSPGMAAADGVTQATYGFVFHVVSMVLAWSLLALSLDTFTHVFAAMESSKTDLADTIRFSPDGVLVVDRDDRVVLANPMAAELLRRPHDAMIGQPIGEVLRTASATLEQLTAGVREDQSSPVQVKLDLPDAESAHVEATWRTMEGGRHQLLLRDITARVHAESRRQLMENQLAHSQRLDAVGRLAGGLAHDFNNILTAVSGSAEMLRFVKDADERTALLDEIIAARDRGAALTKQLLSFARREVTQPRVVDVAEQVRGLERLLERVAGDRNRLRLELAPGCRVKVDPGQLEQALVNLVSNARDAMPEGGNCTVRVARASDSLGASRVLLTVSDEGQGMSAEVAARAFEPFFTTKPRGRGTGLGLASVHGMAEQSHGSARLRSLPGKGTWVTIELPAVEDAATIVTAAPAEPAEFSGGHSILVAEDDSGTRRIVERILRHAGYVVRSAGDGAEALAIIESATEPFDLVLSDVMMPGLTGPELADRVRALHPDLPVLLMTGYAEEQLGALVDGLSGREVLTKPFSGSALTARLAELLRTAASAGTRSA